MSDIRVGILGFRNIGRRHAEALLRCDRVTFAAVADLSKERLEEARNLAPDCRCYTDLDGLIADESLDAIINTLPNHLHASVSVRAMEAGKDVLVEKPLAESAEAAREMIAARNRTGRTLMVGMNQRFSPYIRALRRAIADGVIGEVTHTSTCWNMSRPPEGLLQRGDWFLSRKQSGGGPLIDLAIHRLDLALYVLGFPKVESLFGVCSYGIGRGELAKRGKVYDIEDGATALLRFEAGSTMALEASYFRNAPEAGQRTVFEGTEGYAVIGPGDGVYTATDKGFERVDLVLQENVPDCTEHFVRILRGEEETGPTAEEGLAGVRIIEAVYESATTGRSIQL